MRWPDWLPRPTAPGADLAAREAAEERAGRARALGTRLREARQAARLSTADVERDTRINRVYIEAIEQAEFEALPAPVYARGFVRSYARYLGLDPEEAVAAVPRDLPRPDGLEPMPGLRRTAPPVLPAVNLPVVAAAGAIGVLALLAVFLIPRLGGGDGIEGASTPTPTATATATGTAVAATAPATPTSTTVPAGGADAEEDGEGEPEPGGEPEPDATVPPFDEGTAPDFTGVGRSEAQRVLDEIEATPVIVEASNDAPTGTVFDQTPAPGTNIQPGDVIMLFISSGQ